MNAFNPNTDGTATTIGKLVFGKNISNEAQEWYILGKDKGVSGENTIIFAQVRQYIRRSLNQVEAIRKISIYGQIVIMVECL